MARDARHSRARRLELTTIRVALYCRTSSKRLLVRLCLRDRTTGARIHSMKRCLESVAVTRGEERAMMQEGVIVSSCKYVPTCRFGSRRARMVLAADDCFIIIIIHIAHVLSDIM